MRRALIRLARVASAAAVAYGVYVAVTWYRYGRTGVNRETDPVLDHFFPRYEVRECHEQRVQAPADVALSVARELSLRGSALARAVFALRSIPSRLRGTPQRTYDRGILEQTLSLGWGMLAETPGEIVMGAVTQPWKADVVFRTVPPEQFAGFSEPGYVKIAWTLAVTPIGPTGCMFRTETRAIATDADSRARFRRYWAFLSPGIRLIRYEMIRLVKSEAARRARKVPSRTTA